MKRLLILATITLAAITGVVPAHAQTGYLDSYLENQRWDNLNRNQQSREPSGKGTRRTRKTTRRKTVVRRPQVQVNGQLLQTPVAPMEINGHTFVPMRSILEALGFTVNHDSKRHLVTATRGATVMKLSMPGSDGNLKNEKSFGDNEKPFIHKGVTMLPLRKISEAVGAQAKYVTGGKTPMISITSK